jgi:hypothetical protein
MVGSDKDLGRSTRPNADDRGWSRTDRVLGGQTIGRSSDVICDLYYAQGDEEHRFLSLASKPRSAVSLILTSKPVTTVLVVWPQNHSLRFSGLGLKTSSCGLVI